MAFECTSEVTVEDTGDSLALNSKVQDTDDSVAFGDTEKYMAIEDPCEERVEEAMFENSEDPVAFGDTSEEAVDTEDSMVFKDTSKSMVFENTPEEVVYTENSMAFEANAEDTSKEAVDTEYSMKLEADVEDTGYYATFEAEFDGVEDSEATFEDAICHIESVISLQGTNNWGNFQDTEDCIDLPTVTHDNSAGFTRTEDTLLTLRDTELPTTTQNDDNSAVFTGSEDTMMTSRDTELPKTTQDDDNSAVFTGTEDPLTTLLDSRNSMEIETPEKVSINLVTPFLDTGGSVKCTLSDRFAKESFQYNTANVLTFGLKNLFEYESYLYCAGDFASPVCRVSGCSAKLIFHHLSSKRVKCVFGSHNHPPEDPKMLGSIQIRNQFKRILKTNPEAEIDEHFQNMVLQLKKTHPERVPTYRSLYRTLYMMRYHAKTKHKSPSEEVNMVHNQRSPHGEVRSPEIVSETLPASSRDSPLLEPINLCRTNKTGSSNYHPPSRPILKTIQLNPDNMNAPLNPDNPTPLTLNGHMNDENCPPYPQMTNSLYKDHPSSYGRCIPGNYSHFSQPPFYVTYGGSVTDSHGRCIAGDYSHLSQPQFHMTYRDPVTGTYGRCIDGNYSHLSQPLTCGGPITDPHGRCIAGDYSHLSQPQSYLTYRGPVTDSLGRCIAGDYSHVSQPYLTCGTRVRDQHDSYGTYIVDRLRKMDEKTVIDVKKAIDSTIREAEMGKFKDIEDHEAWL